MRLVFIGLSLSSSWGNTHAITYRTLLKGLAQRGHESLFLERDQPWHAANRDFTNPDFCCLRLYNSVSDLWSYATDVAEADAVIIGSHIPHATDVIAWAASARRGALCFYDFDTHATLRNLAVGGSEYMLPSLIPLFDFYFSTTGGPALEQLQRDYAASQPTPLYGSIDADSLRPSTTPRRWDLGYLGAYSQDHFPALERLLLEPARRSPERRFVVAGPQYPTGIAWPANVERISHLPPPNHAAFYAACGWILHVAPDEAAGYSPSTQLFEAAAHGGPVITNARPGLEDVFEPGREILIAETADDILNVLAMHDTQRQEVARAGRRRSLRQHTGLQRAAELEAWLKTAAPQTKFDWFAAPPYAPELVGVDLAQ